jgi:uncharacterized protein (DUF1778 family)
VTRDRTVSLRIEGDTLSLSFTEDEYAALRRAAVADESTTSRYLRQTACKAACRAPVADAAEAARLPLSSWVRIVVLARLGLTSLGEQLGVFG